MKPGEDRHAQFEEPAKLERAIKNNLGGLGFEF